MIGSIRQHQNWHIVFGNDQKQVLYYAERPSFKFPVKEEQRDGKTILKSDGKPQWQNILLEIPTRHQEHTAEWLQKKDKHSIILLLINHSEQVIEEWFVQDAKIIHINYGRARAVDLDVVRVQVSYVWARRRK
jgi:hypothetical protein